MLFLPSVLWRCWLGGRKGIRPVKKLEWWGTGVVICLERDSDLHIAQLMPLPLTVSCFSKIQIGFTFLVPAHPGSPGKRAVKRVCVCVCVWMLFLMLKSTVSKHWRHSIAKYITHFRKRTSSNYVLALHSRLPLQSSSEREFQTHELSQSQPASVHHSAQDIHNVLKFIISWMVRCISTICLYLHGQNSSKLT